MFISKIFKFVYVNILSFYSSDTHYKVLSTSILNFFPPLKLHHIIVINNKNSIYTLDFTPLNQTKPSTLLKLLFNRNVPAEIRLRELKNIPYSDNKRIIEGWDASNQIDYIGSQKRSREAFNRVQFSIFKRKLSKIIQGRAEMNLYKYNCQHFSYCAIRKIINGKSK